MPDPLVIAVSDGAPIALQPQMANRHGLITGATGTGKTVSLQVLAERFSQIGVPVFMADVKGDLAGLSQPGQPSDKFKDRLTRLGMQPPAFAGMPVTMWDVFGKLGHPLRATVSDLGPLLLSRMLGLNDTQEGVLHLVFRIADDRGLLLLDLKDLRAMIQHVGDNAGDFQTEYGNISAASIGAIQRGLLQLKDQGADLFMGEPMLNLDDLMQTDAAGHGVVNILAADQLMNSPRLYSSLLLWLLSELFEHLPEVGDRDQPKLVFFFDEAHLLFNEAPRALLDKIEQVVRLVRSKGVGVYFVTQNPLDVPDTVLGQLSNRVQHALRAFTPRDQKAVKSAADTMRPNPKIDTAAVITELAVGEALISFLDEHGKPEPVQRAFILPPASRMGPITADERALLIKNSIVAGVYDQAVDRESAYELLKGRVLDRTAPRVPPSAPAGTAAAPGPAAPVPAASPGSAPASGGAGTGGTSSGMAGAAGGTSPDAGSWGNTGRGGNVGPQGATQAGPSRSPGPVPTPAAPSTGSSVGGMVMDVLGGLMKSSGRKDSVVEAVMKSAGRSMGSTVGREITRSILGSLLGKGR